MIQNVDHGTPDAGGEWAGHLLVAITPTTDPSRIEAATAGRRRAEPLVGLRTQFTSGTAPSGVVTEVGLRPTGKAKP